MAGRFAHPRFRSHLADGTTPNASGKVYIYETGTTTKVAAGSALNARGGSDVANPLILDAAGEGDLWLLEGAQYTIKIDTSADVQLSSTDGISSNDLSTWVATGSNVYYSAGQVYIGASSGSETLTVTGTASVSSTLAVTGVATFTAQSVHNGGIFLGDSDSITLGDGNDATMKWDGSQVLLTAALVNITAATSFSVTTGDVDFANAGTVLTAVSKTTKAGINIPSGTAPTSPTEGDFWYDGTNLKFEDGIGTKTITWS